MPETERVTWEFWLAGCVAAKETSYSNKHTEWNVNLGENVIHSDFCKHSDYCKTRASK